MYTTSCIPFHPFLVMRTTASCTMYTVSDISTHYTPSYVEDSVAQWKFFCFIRRRTRVQFPFRIVPLFKVFFLYFFYSYCLNVLIKCSLHFVCGFSFCQLFFFCTMKRNCVNNYWSITMYCEKGWLVELAP